MTRATGIGSHPGTDQHAFEEATRRLFGEAADEHNPGVFIPYVPEVPGRGVGADMIGRSLALLEGLGFDLQPSGWRITDSHGVDARRAVALRGQDLDFVEDIAQGYAGALKVQVAGPWTLAAMTERPRGDRVLADHGLRRELAESLALGVAAHVSQIRRRVAGAQVIVQVDEPALPGVLAGAVPTASGFGRHRSVDAQGAAPALQTIFDAVRAADAEPWVHCCARDVPFELLARSGAPGLSVDAQLLDAHGLDAVAEHYEQHQPTALGLVSTTRVPESDTQIVRTATRLLDQLGLEPTDKLVITPTCGLAGAEFEEAARALRICRTTAQNL